MPTIKAGDLPQTISLPEGQVLTVTGAPGATGVVYLLDPVLGGTNSLQSWAVVSGALAPIGPYAGEQRLLVTCSAGSVIATTANAAVSAARVGRDVAGVAASVGDGSTQIPLRVNQLVGSMRAAGTGLPAATNSVSSGAATKSFAGAISAWGPFHAVQLIFGNHTATPAVIDNSCVATSSTAYPGGVFNIAAPSSGFGAPTGPVTVPAAIGADATAMRRRPGIALSPKMPARSVPRAAGELDNGKYELLFWRNVRLGNNNTFTFGDLGTGFPAAWDAVNEGFSILTADPTFGVDTVANPGSVVTSTRETGVAGLAIVGALFHYDRKMTTIGGAGDSIFVGSPNSSGVIGAPYIFKAAARVRATGKMVSYFNGAISGSSMQAINLHGRDIVDLNMLDIMVVHSHTINGMTPTQLSGNAADWDGQWYFMMDLIQYHLDKKSGNQVLILTPLPNDSFTPSQNALRLKQRDRVINSGLPYVDVESLADSLGHWANPAHVLDGTHPSPLGHEALCEKVKPVLLTMVP
ncbi:SGNH/GDSL hydrolase family protein [Janthinobacterium sp. LB2P10]|uniref:SGNH/GDSL hydrolase family protein n=1 Tax=Janthinobacterium sp. LB2P10 TaxID=3424194 RepID=UPI003F24E468